MHDIIDIIYKSFITTGSRGGKINSIDVEGCSAEPCNVHKGNTYHVRVNFTASKYLNQRLGEVCMHKSASAVYCNGFDQLNVYT